MCPSSRGFPRRSQRRSTAWSAAVASDDLTLSATARAVWSTGAVPSVEGLTIVRTRGQGMLTLASATGAGDGFRGAMGIGIVSDEAFAIGATAMPGPLTQAEWPGWMWHQFFVLQAVTATIADGVNANSAVYRFEIDSKAMRKVPVGMTIFGMIDVTELGTASLELQAETRMLGKNP